MILAWLIVIPLAAGLLAWALGRTAVGDAGFNAPDVSSLAAAVGLPLGIGAPPTGTVTCVPILGEMGMYLLATSWSTPSRMAIDEFVSPGLTVTVALPLSFWLPPDETGLTRFAGTLALIAATDFL